MSSRQKNKELDIPFYLAVGLVGANLYVAADISEKHLGSDATITDVASRFWIAVPLVPKKDMQVHWDVRRQCTSLMRRFNGSYEEAAQTVSGYDGWQLQSTCEGMKNRRFWFDTAQGHLKR